MNRMVDEVGGWTPWGEPPYRPERDEDTLDGIGAPAVRDWLDRQVDEFGRRYAVFAYRGDGDLNGQLADALRGAGWTVTPPDAPDATNGTE